MQVGVIGLGFMGAAHVAAIDAYPDAELVAIASRNEKARNGDFSAVGGNLQLEKYQVDFSRVTKYDDWRGLIADPAIEAVSICLPTNFHSEVTIAALMAGKHVLCEKPMALSVSDCISMMNASVQAQRTLMIGQVLRFWPEYQMLKEFVMSGRHGRIRQATFVRKCGVPDWSVWLTDDSQSGGAVMDFLVHDIDQILMLFGMPDRVTAKRLGDGDALMASFIYPITNSSGPEVRLHGGWFGAGMPFHMSFQVRADQGEMELTPQGLMMSDISGVRSKLDVPPGNAYSAEMRYFLDCCRDGVAPLLCPPADSARAVKVALALKESRGKDGEQVKCLA